MSPRAGRRGPALLSWLAVALILVGGVRLLADRRAASAPAPAPECLDAGPECVEAPTEGWAGGAGDPFASGPRVAASEACRDAGYLCAALADGPVRVRRWKGFEGTIVVHVPAPEFEPSDRARELQRAAAAGIRAWNGQPFPILIDERGLREAHFSVRWSGTLGGTMLGRAETLWSRSGGLQVVRLDLATRSPFDPSRGIAASQVRLTAAHEMGHALGLGHSDSERDLMYPTNTATAPSAQDYKTLHALYALEDGVEIVP